MTPFEASVWESARASLDALGLRGGGCLLRRQGTVLVPEPLPGSSLARSQGPVPLTVLLGRGEGSPSSASLQFSDAEALAPLRHLVGERAAGALIAPVPPPSTDGEYGLFLLVWFEAEPHAAPHIAVGIRGRIADLAESLAPLPSVGGSDGAEEAAIYREAFEANSHGLILLNEAGEVLRLNRPAKRLLGLDAALRPCERLLERLPEGAAERLRALIEAAKAGAWASEEIDFAGHGSSPRLLSVSLDMVPGRAGLFLATFGDLTERERLVDLLRREKDFTRSLLEAANSCVLGVDVEGRTILFNQVFQDLTAYRLADVLGRDALEVLVSDEHRPAWRDIHLRALAGEPVADQDLSVRTRAGGDLILCLSAGRINDAAGACRGVLWTGRDVTEERRRESELRIREETTSRSLSQLKEFSRISSMILQEKDLDTVCKMFVEAISKVSTFRRAILTLCDDDFRGYQWYFAGLTPEEIDTFHRNKMTSRERITIFQERYRLGNSYYIPHSEGWHYQGVRSRADACEMLDWHPDDFLFIPLYGTNRKIVGILSVDDPEDGRRPTPETISPLELFANQVAHSIEERKLDQEVRQTTERYRTLVEAMYDGVFTVDLRERVLFANAAMSQLLGVRAELIRGRPLGSFMESEDLSTFRQETALHDGGRVARFEMRLRAGSDELISVHLSASPFREEGVLKGCFAVVRDLREQKKAEMDRKAMQEQLMQAEKLSALGELISGIAHELNNPLTGVMGYSQLLLSSDTSPDTKKDLEKIHREAVRCQKIVQNLLTFARRRSPERNLVDVNALVEATLELRAYQLKVDGVDVSVDLEPDLPPTLGDFHQLQQVFLNVVNNAHHAILETGRPGRMELRTRRAGDSIHVTIKDTGPGIPPEYVKRIFDPFFTTKEIGKGTGLGLSLSYGIVKEHGGRIEVASRPGEGACFTVELPVRKEAEEGSEIAERADGPAPAEGKNILVVDDEETILELLESVLAASGHRVDTASNGRQALEKIRQVDYDIIITDVKMPDMGGQKLYECLSEIKPHLRRRVVFSTGDTVNPVTQALFRSTGSPCLSKPFRLEEVDEIVHRILREAASGETDPVA